MNIFSDFHHSGLYYSLKLLLEDRLNFKLYRPVGIEWFPEWWRIAAPYNDNIDTAKQYLDLRDVMIPKDGTPPLNVIKQALPTHYEIEEKGHGYIQKALTFQQFLDMDIDIIIASIPDHWITYKKLRDKYKPKAKLVCHMGNIGWHNLDLLKDGQVSNLMASVKPFNLSRNINSVFYHQEISTEVFSHSIVPDKKKISSFVIGLPQEETFFQYKEALPEYTFTPYASKYAPFISTIKELSEKMRETDWIYHLKPGADGFGHILYSSAFVGRPLLINFADYKDKLGGELLFDGQTAIDIGERDLKENVRAIRELDPKTMGLKISALVRTLVNYEEEALKIEAFLSNLKG